jgi:hypothetical protein
MAVKEMIFIIDQSGSQSGWPLAKAKETLAYLVRHMTPADTFQLLGFNTRLNPCFPAPVRNTPEHVARALAFLDGLDAGGGTDIMQGVDYAARLPRDAGRERMVCYLTDGYVGNDMQVLAQVRARRDAARFFPFGIGNAVNRLLIDGMAREGGGVAEYVSLADSGQEAAARFYRRITQPLLTDIAVKWEGVAVADVTPQRIPDLFPGGHPVVLKGRFTPCPGIGQAVITGRYSGQPWRQVIPVRFPERQPENDALRVLWAREQIEQMQRGDWLGAQARNPMPGVEERIVALALEHGLMSQWTSFVAVEERRVNMDGRPRRVEVPLETPAGMAPGDGAVSDEVALRSPVTGGGYAPRPNAGWTLREQRSSRMKLGIGAAEAPADARHVIGGAAVRYSQEHEEGWYGHAGAAPATLPTAPSGPTAGMSAPSAFADGHTTRIRLWDAGRRAFGPASPASGRSVARADAGVQARSPAPQAAGAAPAPGAPAVSPPRRHAARGPREPHSGMDRTRLAEGAATPPAQAKLAASLRERLRGERDAGKRVEVQIWLEQAPPDAREQLKRLGFELAAELAPGRLWLGQVALGRLRALAELPWVTRVEPPRFR